MSSHKMLEIWNITPLDGRYRRKLEVLSKYVSEGALISYRIKVEAQWLLFLLRDKKVLPQVKLDDRVEAVLISLSKNVPSEAAERVKEIEDHTNHDVKAVEYYLRDVLKAVGAGEDILSMIHFACTSEDINNCAYGLMLNDLRRDVFLPAMHDLLDQINLLANTSGTIPMLARTHGQTASPTTMGKEMAVYVHRLKRATVQLQKVEVLAKMNGAVGNYNAHVISFPDLDWPKLSREFIIKYLGLDFNPLTTQIENHDALVEYCDAMRRYNTILIDFTRDVWGYISLGYFKLQKKENEVGSSTMPHKVNPIDFENAEGNLGLANALAEHFGAKLPISRWQRDLSDSTVLRSLGCFAGYSLLAYLSCGQGIRKLTANEEKIASDLDDCWEVLAEAVQTVMRKYGVSDAYEKVKSATRGHAVTKETLASVIDQCAPMPNEVKKDLKALKPRDYTGLAAKLAQSAKDKEHKS